jgi:hypothetical protein
MLMFEAAVADVTRTDICVKARWPLLLLLLLPLLLLLLLQVSLTWTAADKAGNKGMPRHAPQHLH